VKFVGISHFHADHTGQLLPFAKATLLIGKGDWDGVSANPPMQGANALGFTPWTKDGSKVEPLTLDKDVFGDGSVIVLRTPGHTPGHSTLLVNLKEKGPVILIGDLTHFQEKWGLERRADLQLRPRADLGVDRAGEEDRRKGQGHGRHPARHAPHRQAAGLA